MVVVSYSGKEINSKLVYYGAGLSGKTTNLESIYEAVPDTSRGKMVSMKTQSDRTLFFDLLPLNLGEIMGFKTRFLLYTVPGQVFYNATRKLVLKGADAIVFVADSEIGKMDENKESLSNLRANLAEYGVKLEDVPWVLQYNKRDLDNRYSIEELQKELNPTGSVPYYEAVAFKGQGVFETFRGISHMLLEKVAKDLRRTPLGGARKNDAAGRPEGPQSTVISNPFSKADSSASAIAPNPFTKPPAGTPAGLQRPGANRNHPAPPAHAADDVNLAGEMPELVVDEDMDGPEAVIEAEPAEDMGFRPDPVTAPTPSSELRTPRLTPMPRREPASGEMRRPPAPAPAPRPEPTRQVVAEPPVERHAAPPAPKSQPLAPQEAVIPVVLPRGSGSREVVIRIIVTEEDRAA